MSTQNSQKVHVIKHPVIEDALAHIRDKSVSISEYRWFSDKICQYIFVDALEDLDSRTDKVETPMSKIEIKKLKDDIVIISILRSGIAMLFGAIQTLPKVKVGFVGLQRDERTAIAYEYYCKIPQMREDSTVIVTDPMLATGGSISHVLDKVIQEKVRKIKVVSIVSAPEGIDHIQKNYPNVDIYTAAVDERLNDRKFIVPGLGDFGDRYFGT